MFFKFFFFNFGIIIVTLQILHKLRGLENQTHFNRVNSKPSFYKYHIKIIWDFYQFQENASEGTPPPEDVFKKPLPPTVKKEESPPPVRLS